MVKIKNFDFVSENPHDCMTDVVLDEVLKSTGLSPEDDESYLSTPQEELDYAKYITMKSLSGISKALIRFDRLCSLSKLSAPDVIINNECRMTLQSLCPALADLDEARGYVKEIFATTAKKKQLL